MKKLDLKRVLPVKACVSGCIAAMLMCVSIHGADNPWKLKICDGDPAQLTKDFKNYADDVVKNISDTQSCDEAWVRANMTMQVLWYLIYVNNRQNVSSVKHYNVGHMGGGTDDALWALIDVVLYKYIVSDKRESLWMWYHSLESSITNNDGNKTVFGSLTYGDDAMFWKWYKFLHNMGFYYDNGKKEVDGWFGLSWKDHRIYNSCTYYYWDYSHGLGPDIKYKNAVTNGLWWYLNAFMYRHPELVRYFITEPANGDTNTHDEGGNLWTRYPLRDMVNQYKLFFEDKRPACPNPNGYTELNHCLTGFDSGAVHDGGNYKVVDGIIKYDSTGSDQREYTYNAGLVLASLGEMYFYDDIYYGPYKVKCLEEGIALATKGLTETFVRKKTTYSPDGLIIYEPVVESGKSDPSSTNDVFKGVYVFGLSQFAEALCTFLTVDTGLGSKELRNSAKNCYVMISSCLKYNAEFVYHQWGPNGRNFWMYNTSTKVGGSTDYTRATELGLMTAAYRVAGFDKTLVDKGIFTTKELGYQH